MIGIVTVYKVNNYGTKLQAYAMQKLMEKYDEAELLGFIPGSDRRLGAVLGKLYLKIFNKKKKQKRPDEAQLKKRNKAISSFNENYKFGKTLKGNSALNKYIYNYRAVVCGSDQLWAPSNVIADYFTLTVVPDDIIKFSYAASFGISSIPKILRKKYVKYLSRMDYISVREENGGEIVKELTGRQVSVVLDPTLMLEAEEWESLCSKSRININEPYIFCYFLGTDVKHREFAKRLSEITGFKIVSIPHFHEWNKADEGFGDEGIYEAGPSEFLSLIKNAGYVCTDSFHGTVFSVIFKKNVAVFERFRSNSKESTNSRIYSLLKKLNMEDRLYRDESEAVEFTENKMNYPDIDRRLSTLRRLSFEYLDGVLNKG